VEPWSISVKFAAQIKDLAARINVVTIAYRKSIELVKFARVGLSRMPIIAYLRLQWVLFKSFVVGLFSKEVKLLLMFR
jgi:hypothetical protein